MKYRVPTIYTLFRYLLHLRTENLLEFHLSTQCRIFRKERITARSCSSYSASLARPLKAFCCYMYRYAKNRFIHITTARRVLSFDTKSIKITDTGGQSNIGWHTTQLSGPVYTNHVRLTADLVGSTHTAKYSG